MATPGKASGSSRWGNFLSVVESKLDTILADAEDGPDEKSAAPSPDQKQAVNGKSVEIGLSRTASTASRTSDRLQERLAKAVAHKHAAQKANFSNDSPRTASPCRSLTSSSPRQSFDSRPARASVDISEDKSPEALDTPAKEDDEKGDGEKSGNTESKAGVDLLVRISTESSRSNIPRASNDLTKSMRVEEAETPKNPHDGSSESNTVSHLAPEEYENLIQQLRADFGTAEVQRQEEVHYYVEQIDSLQAKLQYLSKEVAESARTAASEAPDGSLEKKLAEKEAQILALMEEGQKLSKIELKNMNMIKKLCAKVTESGKEVEEALKKAARAEQENSQLSDRVRKSELAEKNLNERVKSMSRLQKEIETMRSEKGSKDSIIAELKAQLEQAKEQVVTEALLAENKRVAELEEELTSLKIEKELAAQRSQARIKELQEQRDHDAERARVVDMEMKAELQMLEGKLEVMRARAEEVSSSATGDAQVKLLRQVETLQSQYATASENWKGIEASLVSRMSILEKERDETAKRETDVRRKAREITMKSKRNEEELEETKAKLDSIQEDLAQHKTAFEKLQKRAEDAENALREAKVSLEQEKQAWRAEKEQQAEDEKSRWRGGYFSSNASISHSRAESPANMYANGQRGVFSPEVLGPHDLKMRKASVRSMNGAGLHDGFPASEKVIHRRASAQPLTLRGTSSRQGTPSRPDAAPTIFESDRGFGDRELPETPMIHTPGTGRDADSVADYVGGGAASPCSPQATLHDMLSVSTVGAGPSVQLVERMSAAVRRLESEKVATQEETARLAAQRDEARRAMAGLLAEAERARAAEARAAALQAEVRALEERLGTALEMLGEKSEMVEELRADVADIKGMYRELVERTVK